MSEIRMRYVGRSQQPYDETVTKWEIITDEPEEEVWKFCRREILSNRPMPTKEEWEEGLRKTDEDDDAEMNFETYAKGYCELVRVCDVWYFIKHAPSLD